MRIQALVYFMEVAETGNITQAAKNLFISQPSLSNAIQALEKEMAITLFHRSKKGMTLTTEGEEFLQYTRQVLEQIELMNNRYKNDKRPKQIFSISGQHYAFAVDAFVKLLKELDQQNYQATLKEQRTYEVIADVATLKSEIGIIYRSHYNQKVIDGTLNDMQLTFTPLFQTAPYVFIDKSHPLAAKAIITMTDLVPFPRLSYEQGTHNSFYFWEEILADTYSPKQIIVSDRATLFNLLIGLHGYTISSGIINEDLNGPNILAIPLESTELIELGYLTNDVHHLTPIAIRYLALLQESIHQYGKGENGPG